MDNRYARSRHGAKMLRLKGCPRCGGDVFFDWDFYGWYEQCLQCGYMHYTEDAVRATAEQRPRAREIARAA